MRNATVRWETDQDSDLSWCEECESGNHTDHVLWGCILLAPCNGCGQDRVLDSLWGIDLGDEGPETASYAREVERGMLREMGGIENG